MVGFLQDHIHANVGFAQCRHSHHPPSLKPGKSAVEAEISRGWKGWQNLINEREVGDQWLDEADGRRTSDPVKRPSGCCDLLGSGHGKRDENLQETIEIFPYMKV